MDDKAVSGLLAYSRAFSKAVLANALRRQASGKNGKARGGPEYTMGEGCVKNIHTDDEDCIYTEGNPASSGWPYTSHTDPVNHPPHYTRGSIECIDAIEAALTPEEFRGYCKGNAIKYIWRERHKGGNESIAKSIWYQQRMSK